MRSLVLLVVGVIWVAGAFGGYLYMFSYESAPLDTSCAASSWPSSAGLQRPTTRFAMVVGIHPHCPCSRASVAELNNLLQGNRDNVVVDALVFKPAEFADDWDRTDLVERLRQVPRVRVHRDIDGAEARRFGMTASGQVLLYGPDNELVFNGGVTAFRGHHGVSIGQTALGEILAGKPPTVTASKVFGCGLMEAGTTEPAGPGR